METEDPEKQRTKTIWSSVGKEDLNKNMLPIVDVSCRIFFMFYGLYQQLLIALFCGDVFVKLMNC